MTYVFILVTYNKSIERWNIFEKKYLNNTNVSTKSVVPYFSRNIERNVRPMINKNKGT